MAKKIKFPLILKDDYQVRTLDELHDYWDLEKIINYYRNGRLLIWLRDRYYENEISQLQDINEQSPDFINKLQNIFGITSEASDVIDLDAITEKQKKIEHLRQFTSDEKILSTPEQVAFDQEELADILDEGYTTIYLCENTYRIPFSLCNKHYIGLGQVQIIVNTKPSFDFNEKGILFTNITLIDSTGKPFEFFSIKDAEKLYLSGQGEAAITMFEKLVNSGNERAKALLGEIYMYDFNFGTYNRGYSLVQESAKSNDILGRFFLAENTQNGFNGIYEDLLLPLKEESKTGNAFSLYALASYYELNGNNKNLQLATQYYHYSAKAGYWRAYRDLGWNYRYGRGVSTDYHKSKEYYLQIAESGDWWAQIQLGELLYNCLEDQNEGLKWYRKGYTPNRMKKDIQNLIEKIDNLCMHYLQNRGIIFKKHPDHNKTFSSKSAAFQMMMQEIIMNIDYINNLLFSTNNADELTNQYITDVRNIINLANLYSQICNKVTLVSHNNQSLIESSIRNSSESLIANYRLSYNDCTYQFSNDDICDNETPFNINRYDSFFNVYKVFETDDYGLGYRTKADDFEKQVNKIVKDSLQPIKSELLKINTEVLA